MRSRTAFIAKRMLMACSIASALAQPAFPQGDLNSAIMFCKGWANDKERVAASVPGYAGYESCPEVLLYVWDSCRVHDTLKSCDVTRQQAETAYRKLDDVKAKNYLDAEWPGFHPGIGMWERRCEEVDPRPLKVKDSDPVCIQKRRVEAERTAQAAQQSGPRGVVEPQQTMTKSCLSSLSSGEACIDSGSPSLPSVPEYFKPDEKVDSPEFRLKNGEKVSLVCSADNDPALVHVRTSWHVDVYVDSRYLLFGESRPRLDSCGAVEARQRRIQACCTDFHSVMAYCKAWAADTEHIPVLPPGQNEDCAHLLFRQASNCVSGWDCNDTSCSGSEYNCKVTSREAQTAYEALSTKEKNDWLAGVGRRVMVTSGAEPPLATRRCTKEDFRSPGEQAADPVCVQKRKEEAEQKREYEAKLKTERAIFDKRKEDYRQATQGLRIGQPQAVVKAMLQARGFAMPWTCSGGMNASGEWTSSCAAFRGQLRLVLYFSIYQRVRVVDPDTGIPHFINEKTDRLTDIFGFNPGYDLVGEEHGKSG
jgi:hypothetical protein